MYYSINDHVNCEFRGVKFTGVITGVLQNCLIVKPDTMTNEIKVVRNDLLDPVDCIVLHPSFVKGKV